MEDQLLTPGEAARRYKRTPETLRRWADEGLVPCGRTETGVRVFKASDLDKFVADRERRRAAAVAR
jgi:DNA-binding transcriptional MerR regulator